MRPAVALALLGHLDAVGVRLEQELVGLVIAAQHLPGVVEQLAAIRERQVEPAEPDGARVGPVDDELVEELAPLFEDLGATMLAGENSAADLNRQGPERHHRLGVLLRAAPPRPANLGELIAMSWLAERVTQLEAQRALGPRVLAIDFDAMLEALPDTLARVLAHLDIPCTADRAAAIARGPVVARYSKAPEHGYSPLLRRDLLAESKKQKAWKRLCQIPAIGPIRAAVLLGILQTAHRFRTNRQLWTYSGLGIEVHSSADHQVVKGQMQRKKKPIEIRGLNRNCNHHLKNLFKGAAATASNRPGPFQEFYAALVAKGMRPEMARLTLARKIATIALIVWKKGVGFDANHRKPQTA